MHIPIYVCVVDHWYRGSLVMGTSSYQLPYYYAKDHYHECPNELLETLCIGNDYNSKLTKVSVDDINFIYEFKTTKRDSYG